MAEASGPQDAGKKTRGSRPAPAKKAAPRKSKPAATKIVVADTADPEMTPAAAAHAEVIEALTAAMPKPASKPPSAAKAAKAQEPQAAPEAAPIAATIPNFERLAQNAARMMTEGSRVMAAYMKPLEAGENPNNPGNEIVDAVRSLGKVAEYWLKDPARTLEAQQAFSTKFIDLYRRADTDSGLGAIVWAGLTKTALAIVGWSYGGYAALQSAVVDSSVFKAVVAIAPVTDLNALKEEHRQWSDFKLVNDLIGDGPHVREGSPAQQANKIKVPVLMFHGTLDRNFGIAQSQRMADALKASGAKYEAGQFVWWNKGSDATLSDVTEGLDAAPVLTCTELIETP